jgi:hypothetical protein
MSLPKIIGEHLRGKIAKDQPYTEVSFAEANIGDFEIVITAQSRLGGKTYASEESVEQELAREGLIRVPLTRRKTKDEFKRIDVAGKPISEMIIEERR